MFDESKHPRDKGKFATSHATSPDRWTKGGARRWADHYLSGKWQKHTRKDGQDFIDGQRVDPADVFYAKENKLVKYRDRDDMDPVESRGSHVGYIKKR